MPLRNRRYAPRCLVVLAAATLAALAPACGAREDAITAASRAEALTAPLTGACRATGADPLLDDMEDGDARLAPAEDRLGVWYAFDPGPPCVQTPQTDATHRFTMTAGGADGSKYAAATHGSGCTANGWSGGGIGVRFLSSYDPASDTSVSCRGGYDARAYAGIAFAVRSTVSVRLQVCTASVTDANCHGYDVAPTAGAWRAVTVPWLQLLQEDWGPTTKTVAFLASEIVSIQFKASSPDFDFAIDDVRFVAAEGPIDAGAPGALHAPVVAAADDAMLATEYDNWKSRHLVRCPDGSADVRKDGDEAVSEGTGYGMLLAVAEGDRATFDALLAGADRRRNARGMTSWRFQVCGGVRSAGAATDGDLDIAMALVQADARWGGYRARAEVLASAIKQYGTSTCAGRTVLRPGDDWGGCADPADRRLNPSYFAPAYYRVFARYLPNQADFWTALADDTYSLLAEYQSRASGLFPDWGYDDGTPVGDFGYEACRVPWRIATDYAWSGSDAAKRVLVTMHDAIARRGGPSGAARDKNSCFLGGMALTALAVGQQETDAWFADWIGHVPQGPDPSMGDNPYFQGTLRVLDLALAGGHFRPALAPAAGGGNGGNGNGGNGNGGNGNGGPPSTRALALDDFRTCDATQRRSLLGTSWYAYDDHGDHGTSSSSVAIGAFGGASGSACALRWSGQVTTAFPYGYAGLGLDLGAASPSGLRALKLTVRGAGATFRVKLPMKSQNAAQEYNDYGATFRCGDGSGAWTDVTIPFASLQQEPGWGVPRPLALDDVASVQVQTVGQPIASFQCDVGAAAFVP